MALYKVTGIDVKSAEITANSEAEAITNARRLDPRYNAAEVIKRYYVIIHDNNGTNKTEVKNITAGADLCNRMWWYDTELIIERVGG